ncbi:MAG: hypothetical protein OYG31_03040 [Candidatus Kaiserbacteria bacterium]|nr:hypothetical protein [Candidatus Kaiserbacteria bacterium]
MEVLDQIAASVPFAIRVLLVTAAFIGGIAVLLRLTFSASQEAATQQQNHETGIALLPAEETGREQLRFRRAAANLAGDVINLGRTAHSKAVKAGEAGEKLGSVAVEAIQYGSEIADDDANIGNSKDESTKHLTKMKKYREQIAKASTQLDEALAAAKEQKAKK